MNQHSNKITVVVSGTQADEKTTIASLIEDVLNQHGVIVMHKEKNKAAKAAVWAMLHDRIVAVRSKNVVVEIIEQNIHALNEEE